MMERELMKIGELERRSGTPRYTIHFYLREGLLHPPVKTGRTIAYYDDSHLKRLQAIKRIKGKMRMPTRFLKEQLDKADKGRGKATVEEPIIKKSFSDKKNQRKQQIVDAAIKLYISNGYHRTKVEDITRAAGISIGTFYQYFSHKSDLFTEVADSVIRSIEVEVPEAIRKEKDLTERTLLITKFYAENYQRFNEILNQLRAETAGGGKQESDMVKRIYLEAIGPLVREAVEAIKNGVIRDVDTELLAFTLIGIAEIMYLRMTLDNKYTFDQMVDFNVDVLMNGLISSSV